MDLSQPVRKYRFRVYIRVDGVEGRLKKATFLLTASKYASWADACRFVESSLASLFHGSAILKVDVEVVDTLWAADGVTVKDVV